MTVLSYFSKMLYIEDQDTGRLPVSDIFGGSDRDRSDMQEKDS